MSDVLNMAPRLAMPLDAQPVCADPVWLPLVDAAFDKPGGPAGKALARLACAHCPVYSQCLYLAMRVGEPGPWAGTAPKTRTQNGGRPTLTSGSQTNLIGNDHGRDGRSDRVRKSA